MMEESTSIHWHGHHQRNSPYMDGVPYVTQCPVPPHSSFRYVYVADNEGTHFWHSHSGCQRGDGAFGSFVVRAPRERDVHRDMYDEDVHVLTVTDWLHELGIRKFLAHYHGSGNNKPETLLVNGHGRYRTFDGGHRTPLARFRVSRVRATQTTAQRRFELLRFLSCHNNNNDDNNTDPAVIRIVHKSLILITRVSISSISIESIRRHPQSVYTLCSCANIIYFDRIKIRFFFCFIDKTI